MYNSEREPLIEINGECWDKFLSHTIGGKGQELYRELMSTLKAYPSG